ncbi:hypothetical protein M0805_000459 [Coniferiporia weirii]|nr:hypothetical protein M0805_000459 [Coniferiporia weirii]
MDVDSPVRAPSPPPAMSARPVELLPPPHPLPPARPLPPPKVKVPRPIKLKPLKEVLLKLIAQIKRKDDYAFFLQPVDQSQVQGYSDIVRTPMDFGTMLEKVERGRYRSLEQFKDDFCLVTSNAKAFNPPSTLYHTEASKIEAWGLEQIARATTQVIEYETDWTIDVVADEEPTLLPVELDESGAPLVEDGTARSGPSRARSPSVLSSAAGLGSVPVERAKRGSRMKKVPVVTESWEEGGHLPGHKDGIGSFPACSDLAALMVELKLRGKRFRTKKERLKREKEGPPFAPDGSLDYTEMENPFSILRNLIPDPPSVPHLVPLISTISAPLESSEGTPEASQPPEEKKGDQSNRPGQGPISVPLVALPSILADSGRHTFANPPTSTPQIGNKKMRHWTITRNPPRAARVRDDEDDGAASGPRAKRRRVEAPDYGAFASLMGTLAAENGIKADDFEEVFANDEKLLKQIRMSIENRTPPSLPKPTPVDREVVLDADEYIRDVVYGGTDSLAYFRSLAEFVGEYHGPSNCDPDASIYLSSGELGMPLAQWVETHIVDPLTQGNHAVLRAIANALKGPKSDAPLPEELAQYLELALNTEDESRAQIRAKMRELEELAEPTAQIDMSALLRAPEELFLAESAWAGRESEFERGQGQGPVPGREPASAVAPGQDSLAAGAANATPGQDRRLGQTAAATAALAPDPTGAIERALAAGAEALRELAQRIQGWEQSQAATTCEGNAQGEEDALVRRTRLNLIALAKRAPIDRIARLPPELVPLHIRHIVPTLGT